MTPLGLGSEASTQVEVWFRRICTTLPNASSNRRMDWGNAELPKVAGKACSASDERFGRPAPSGISQPVEISDRATERLSLAYCQW